MIDPYYVALCQVERIAVRAGGLAKLKDNMEKNINRYRDFIDFVAGGYIVGKPGFSVTGAVRLVTFGEFALTGRPHPASGDQDEFTNQEIREHLGVKIPGPETDRLAEKAKQWGVYVAAANHEQDPEWPDLFFNTGFIINPRGKIILKYRKTVTNNPIELSCSVHDIMDKFKDPISGKYDAFPVVDTEIGKLAIFVCADLIAPEIPRIYAMKGAEVLMHLTSGMSTAGGGTRPIGVTEATLKVRAADNVIYLLNSNWGPELNAYYPKGRVAGYSNVFDYLGNELARADDSAEQIVRTKIDIEALRKYREQYFRNFLTMVRTELYAPYYNQTIYPPNTFLKDGPVEVMLEEKHLGRFRQAKENLKNCYDSYHEDDVK